MCGKGSQTSTSTTVNQVPPEVLAQYQNVIARANDATQSGYTPYTGQLTAGINGTQDQAQSLTQGNLANLGQIASLGGAAAGAANVFQPYFDQATTLADASARPTNVSPISLGDIAQYESPYQQQVVDATLANINQQNAQQQQGVISDAIKQGNAFGGDRMGVAQAALAGQQDLAKNQTIANLNNQNYSQALGEANNQQQIGLASQENNAARAGQAAGLYGTLGSAASSNTLGALSAAGNLYGSASTGALNTAGSLFGIGSAQQQTSQNALNAQYQQFQNQVAFPYQQIGWLGNISEGIGTNSGGTSSTTSTAPAPFFSDKRVKEDIKQIGTTKDGLKIVRFRYKGRPEYQIGLIAQDVLKHRPDAVSSHNGILAVDYGKATEGSVRQGKFAFGGGIGGSMTAQQGGGNIYPGMDAPIDQPVIASPQLAMGHTLPQAPQPKQQQDQTGQVIANKALGMGMDAAGKKLDPLLKDAWSSITGSAPTGLGAAAAAPVEDPLAASLAAGSGLAPAAEAGAGAAAGAGAGAAGAADLGAAAATAATADAAGASLADVLPFLLFAKRGGRITGATLADAARPRRAVGGRMGYFDGGATDDSPVDIQPMTLGDAPDATMMRLGDAPDGSVVPLSAQPGDQYPRTASGVRVRTDAKGNALGAVDAGADQAGSDTWSRMIRQESGGKQFGSDGQPLTSPKGAVGIAQVMPGTAPEAAKLAGVPFDEQRYRTDPNYNLQLGKAYFQKQLQDFGSPDLAAAAYNAGPGAVQTALDRASRTGGNYLDYLPAETRQYVGNVTGKLQGIAAGRAMAYADQQSGAAGADASRGIAGATLADAAAPVANDNSLGTAANYIGDTLKQPGMGSAILAGLFGMLGSKSHTFLGALGEGGLAGVGTYQKAQEMERQNKLLQNAVANTQSEIAMRRGQLGLGAQRNDIARQQLQRQQELNNATIGIQRGALTNATANTQSEIDARRAGQIEKTLVPGVGWMIYDKAHPEQPPKFLGSDGTMSATPPLQTPSAAPPADAAPVPGTGTVPAPSSAPLPAPAPGAATAPVASASPAPAPVQPARTAAPAQTAAGWAPTTEPPPNFLPPNHINLAMNPNAMKEEQQVASKTLESTRSQANTARQALYRLDEMDQQIANLPKSGFLAQGSFATERANFAKNANAVVQSFGGQPIFDPSSVASIEQLAKDRFRLGAELSKSIGGREPGFIVQQAVTANPGADNSAMGYKRIVSGLRQAQMYDMDRAQFMDNYFARFNHLNGAETAFNKMNPPQKYSERAIAATVDPRDAAALKENPKLAARVDAKYGAGVSKLLMGGQ